jgi:hypothetical protein
MYNTRMERGAPTLGKGRTMKKLIGVLLALFTASGCTAARESESVSEVTQGLHYGIWQMNPDEDAIPNAWTPGSGGGLHWPREDDWRTTTTVTPSQTFAAYDYMWFSGTSCGWNCAGEVYEPAVGIASNPSLYNAIVSIDHVDLYFAFQNTTGHNVTLWLNVLDEKWTVVAGPGGPYLGHGAMYGHNFGGAYTKQDFADPAVDGIYFGVGAESTPISPGYIAIGAVRLEVVYATP